MFTGALPTGTVNNALLLPVLAGGSFAPLTLATLVTLGTAVLLIATLMVIATPVAPAAITALLVQVTIWPAAVHVQPAPPEPAAT